MRTATETLAETVLEVAPLLVLALCIGGMDRDRFKPRWLLVALLIFLLHELLLTRFLWSFAAPWDDTWNWTGKVLALLGSLAIAAHSSFGFRRAGISLFQASGCWPAWLFTSLLCAFYIGQAAIHGGGSDSAESIAFMCTAPGLEEEVFYRGILLLSLNEAFTARRRIVGIDMGWGALLTALLFGAIHGISYREGQPILDLPYFTSTFVSGLLLVWLRERTGSLLAPVLCHNVMNAAPRIF